MIKIKFIPKYFPVILLPLYWIWFLLYYIFGSIIYLIMTIFSPFKTKENIIDFYMKKQSKLERNLTLDEEIKEEVDEEASSSEVEDEPDIRF